MRDNIRKAAIVFASLPAGPAEQVAMHLSEQHLSELHAALGSIGTVTDHERQAVTREFVEALQHSHSDQNAVPRTSTNQPPDAKLGVGEVDLRELQHLLEGQHPQFIALVLSRLNPDKGAALFSSLPPDVAVETGVRMALVQNADKDVVARVDSLLSATRTPTVADQEVSDRAHRVLRAGLKYADKEIKRGILGALVDHGRADLASEIGESLYVFEDLLSLEDRYLQQLLSQIALPDLAMALKGVEQHHREVVFRNLSERAATALREEMEYLGPVRRRDVEAAQEKFMEVANQLVEDGVIDLYPGEDEYIE